MDVFHAKVKGRGVKGANNEGIWVYKGSNPALQPFAQEGEEAPGAAGVRFKRFLNVSLMTNRGPLFTAELEEEGVQPKAARSTGLWATDKFGTLHLLLRTGDLIDGRTVRSFQTLEVISGSAAQQRAWSASVPGSIVSRCFFEDGTDAIILLKVP